MDISYRRATEADIEFLVGDRLAFIELASWEEGYEFIRNNIREYFQQAMEAKQCDVILAELEGTVIGTGVVFYYSSIPSKFNPWGKNAYFTSMFVAKGYRRQGIASKILEHLISIVREKGYHVLLLQESELGRPLYEKFGFTPGKAGMTLKI